MATQHTKVDASPLLPLAKGLAGWLIPRLPGWVTPNQLSALGIGFTCAAGLSFYLASFARAWLFVASAALVLNWVADNTDGELARARGLTSERGFFLDLFLDALGTLAVALGLAFASYTVLAPILLFEIVHLFTVILIFAWIHLRGIFPLAAFGPAEMRVVLILLAVLTYFTSGSVLRVGALALGWFDLAAVVMVLFGSVQVSRSAVRLYLSLAPAKR